jgi:hypothetical protein
MEILCQEKHHIMMQKYNSILLKNIDPEKKCKKFALVVQVYFVGYTFKKRFIVYQVSKKGQ